MKNVKTLMQTRCHDHHDQSYPKGNREGVEPGGRRGVWRGGPLKTSVTLRRTL